MTLKQIVDAVLSAVVLTLVLAIARELYLLGRVSREEGEE